MSNQNGWGLVQKSTLYPTTSNACATDMKRHTKSSFYEGGAGAAQKQCATRSARWTTNSRPSEWPRVSPSLMVPSRARSTLYSGSWARPGGCASIRAVRRIYREEQAGRRVDKEPLGICSETNSFAQRDTPRALGTTYSVKEKKKGTVPKNSTWFLSQSAIILAI